MSLENKIFLLIVNYMENPRELCPNKIRIYAHHVTIISKALCYNLVQEILEEYNS